MKPHVAVFAAGVMALGLVSVGEAAGQSGLQQPLAAVDVKRIERFCDVGVRFQETGIKFDLEKLLGLKLEVDPKVLQTLTSQAAFQIAALTFLCRYAASGLIPPDEFVAQIKKTLEYAKDLEGARMKAEETAKVQVSKKEEPRLDPAQVAQAELGLKVEASIDLGGPLQVVLRRLAVKYACVCLPDKKT